MLYNIFNRVGLSPTSLAQSNRDLLHLLYCGTGKKGEDLGDTPPPRAMEELGQTYTEGGVPTVHVRYVTRVLEETQQISHPKLHDTWTRKPGGKNTEGDTELN